MRHKILCPSLLNVPVQHLAREMELIEQTDVDILHLDLMDGTFVPNFGLSLREIEFIRSRTQKLIDCHMMIMQPRRYIQRLADIGCDIVYIHPESELIPSQTLDDIQVAGMQAGIVLNPCTSISSVMPLLPQCRYVMMMGVNPGFAGRDFMPHLLPKFAEIAKVREENKLPFTIVLDGGANQQTITQLYHDYGIEGFVLGKQEFFFQNRSYLESTALIRSW